MIFYVIVVTFQMTLLVNEFTMYHHGGLKFG